MQYYLTISPSEALIASMLSPIQFGSYMANGLHRTTSEQLIFLEILEEFGSDFDWEYAHRTCVPHLDGSPKNSVYMSIYRVLERTPLSMLGTLYLVTSDGRSLPLSQGPLKKNTYWRGHALYKEIAPITPLVMSNLPPESFSRVITDCDNHVSVPAIAFADLKTEQLQQDVRTVNRHLFSCLEEMLSQPHKQTKTIDRSFGERFCYADIDYGIYIARYADGIVCYPMLSSEEIHKSHFEWGHSARIF